MTFSLFVELAAKAAIVLALGAAVAACLRHASAATRHLVWTSTLLAVLALPIAALVMPDWNVSLVQVQVPAQIAGHDASTCVGEANCIAPTPPAARERDVQSTAPALRTSPVDHAPGTFDELKAALQTNATTVALYLWLAGAAAILLRLLVGIAAVGRLARRSELADGARWISLARELAADLGVTRVEFRRGPIGAMPMTWGVLKPVVLLPADAEAWPEDRLRIVLLHELAHVKRADCLTHLLAQAACALYWINPLAWIAARRARSERERACDDLVLACGTPGPDYATQLLEVARVMRAGRLSMVTASASLAMAHRSQLEGRLMAILDPTISRTTVNRVRGAAAASAALLLISPLAALQPWATVEAAMIPAQAVTAPPKPAQAPKPAPTPMPTPSPAPAPRAPRAETVPQIEEAATAAVAAVLERLPEIVDAALDQSVDQSADQSKKGSAPDPKVVAALLEAVKDSDKEVRESAMHALVRLRHPATFEPLVQALRDGSADVRESAVFGLGQLRDKRAVEPLRGALKDSSASVREQAVFALGQFRDPSTFDALVEATRDSSASVREQAVFALGQLRDPRAVDPLIVALRDASSSVREQAAFALGQLRAKTAVDGLIAALKESDVDVREQAAFALGQIRDPRAIDALTAALKDTSPKVRQQVAFALGQLVR